MRTILETESQNQSLQDHPSPDAIVAEQAADHARELRRLSDLAFVFLNATDGDRIAAENLLDSFLGIVFEGGILSSWRYRILLAEIRKGL